MTQDNSHNSLNVDDLLSSAAQQPVELPDGLAARVMQDALAAQPVGPVRSIARPSLVSRLIETLGGWFAVGGLATAACAGFLIGVSGQILPDDMAYMLSGDLVTDEEYTSAEVSGFGWDLE